MTKNTPRFSLPRLALAALLIAVPSAAPAQTAPLADATFASNSMLGTYLAARLAQQLRDNDAADALLKTALDRDPANASLLEQAFVTELVGGNWQRAVGYAGRAVASDPGNHLAHLILGVDAFKAGRFGEADRHLAELGATPVAIVARAWVADARRDNGTVNTLLGSINNSNWLGYFRKLQLAAMADLNGDRAGGSKIYEDLFAVTPGEFHLALAYAKHASHFGDNKLAAAILANYAATATLRHPLVDSAMAAIERGQVLPLELGSTTEGLAQTFFGFSQALDGQGGLDLAMIYVRLALELKPDDELSLFSLASILEQVHKYDAAIAVYKRIPDSSPLHFDAAIRIGLNLDALDRTDEGKATLRVLAEPGKAGSGDHEAARAALHAQIEALANVGPRDKREAIASLQKLLEQAGFVDVGREGVYGSTTRKSISLLQKDASLPVTGTFDAPTRKALEDRLVGAAKSAPLALSKERLIDLHTTIGNMLRGRKQFAEAAEEYSKSIDLIDKPVKGNWDQYYSRAVCYERMNKWSLAEADFLKAMDLNPDEPLILNYLGYSWVDRNEHIDKALELIKKAVGLKPEDGYYVDSLGWAYFKMGRYQDAVEQLEHAVELKADDAVINDHLGDAYWRNGRRLEAQFQWSTSLSSKPEAEDIPKLQEKLKHGLPPESGAATASSNAAGADQPKQP